MHQMIFVNLPVADLDVSRRFFTALGYAVNEAFSDDNAVCVTVSDTICVMLLRRDFFAGFTPRAVADAHEVTEALLCLNVASRDAVDELAGRAVAAGGRDLRTLQEENAAGVTYLYARSYADLDGHIWELLWMDPAIAA